ncbi:MAG: hypothetical protein ABIW79_02660 [Gemmatimonas sp.]
MTEQNKAKGAIRIEFTPAQQAQVLQETNLQADAIELTASELEERIAPRMMF